MAVSSNIKFALVCALFVAMLVDNVTRPAPSVFNAASFPELSHEYISPLYTESFAYTTWSVAVVCWVAVTVALFGVVDSRKVILAYRQDQTFENAVGQYVVLTIAINSAYTIAQSLGQVRVAILLLEIYVGLTAKFYTYVHRRKNTKWFLRTCVGLTLAWSSYGLCLILTLLYGLPLWVCLIILAVWTIQLLLLSFKSKDITMLTIVMCIVCGILV